MVWTQKHWFCSNHGLSLNQSMCVNQGFGKGHIKWRRFGKGNISKGYARKRCSAQKPVDQVLDIRSDGANRWQTQQKNGNKHWNDSKMCKTKPVLSEAWAELSPPQRKERSRRNEEELGGGGGGWVQVIRGKNPCQGGSLDKTKTKQTVQLRTSKIHKTRRQAGGFQHII